MTQNLAELNLAPISNEKLITFINFQLPITNKELTVHLINEFKNRKLDYRHLYNSKTDELTIKLPLDLIDGCIFERNIPKPPLVGNFYPIVRKLKNFLTETEKIKGKNFKTFDYIFDQLYLSHDLIEVISEESVQHLTEQDVFIGFKNSQQTFPNQTILNQITASRLSIIVDKGKLFRGLEKVVLVQHNQIIKEKLFKQMRVPKKISKFELQ